MSIPIEELNSIKKNPSVLRVYASRVKLEKQGKDYFGRCVLPGHKDSTPSFSVSQDANGCWLYYCHGCGRGGDPIKFLQELDNLTFNQAVNSVKETLGSNWNKEKAHVEQVFKPIEKDDKEYKTFSLAEYRKLELALEASKEGQDWLLTERGITYVTARKLRFGFRQDLGRFAGEKNKDIADKGWISLPCIEGDTVISIKYRSIAKKAFSRQSGMRTELIGLDSIDIFEPIVVVEGEFDRAVMEQSGFKSVSLPNANFILTPEMRDRLLEAEYVILAGDCDGKVGVKAMERLKVDFGKRALLVQWPEGCKDANDALRSVKNDSGAFRELFLEMISRARSQPMPGVYSLVDVMTSSDQPSLVDHPDRLRFPWKQVDEMAILLPGSVAFSTSTNSGMGKTIFWMNVSVFCARKFNEVVLNYQCELSPDELSNAVAAHVLAHDRNNLAKEDYKKAASLIKGTRYYVGSDPSLTDFTQVLDLIEAAVKHLGITLVVLDHLHFICGSASDTTKAQGQAMQRIKNMAKVYGLKFIVLGQPRKADQKSKGKRLHISDIKDSGSIGDASDTVYFLHREVITNIDPSNPPMDQYEPETEVSAIKTRSKGKGKPFSKLYYYGPISTFLELSNIEEDQYT